MKQETFRSTAAQRKVTLRYKYIVLLHSVMIIIANPHDMLFEG